jgi:DNA-binding transcriptional MerR regulator
MTHAAEIPNKLYFRIGEVSELIDVKPYVLRYWERNFRTSKPTKSKSGQRLYKRRDVELLFKIKSCFMSRDSLLTAPVRS